jgi:hypothetical protein
MNAENVGAYLLIGFIIGLAAAGLISASINNHVAVEHNAAHYDNKTGAFTWNDETNSINK